MSDVDRNAGPAGSPAGPSALYWQLTAPDSHSTAGFSEGHDFAGLVEAIANAIAAARSRYEMDLLFSGYVGLRPTGSPQPDGNHPKVAPAVERPGERTREGG